MHQQTIIILLTGLLLMVGNVQASDHADPIQLQDPLEPDLTGLFVFPDNDDLIVILTAYRGLSFDPPYNLEPFEYRIHFDWDSEVNLQDEQSLARYGGKILNPAGIKANALIVLNLNNNASLADKKVRGFANDDNVEVWTGVRDDPFIFPRFFGTNVISMVVRIPQSELPRPLKHLLVWGSSHDRASRDQIDHVGRSNRTQLARFDFLNTLPPSEHVGQLQNKLAKGKKTYAFLKKWIPPLGALYELQFLIREYDIQPDVLIYSTARPAGFPNGRWLTDDVAELTCILGDCPLVEVSYIEGKEFPRASKNDKAFLSDFPFLAEPWPGSGHPDNHFHVKLRWIVILIIFALLAWFIYRRVKRQHREFPDTQIKAIR